jgi:molybdate-binding protein/DNA-binding XRE family transcriptional regulator
MEVNNNLAQLRQKRGLSAAKLASAIGVSRQTIYAMESGSFIPNTVVALNLAKALAVKVEDVYSLENAAVHAHIEEVEMLPGGSELWPGQPVRLCRVDDRLMAASPEPGIWSLPLADAVATQLNGGGKRVKVQVFEDEIALDKRLLIAGCDPGITILAHHLMREGVELVVEYANSTRALDLLKEGAVHIAGTHLRDSKSGEPNLPVIRKMFRSNSVAVVSFAQWQAGIVLARGNPKNIRGIDDLGRSDVKIANRDKGSGCRLLLDSQLHKAKIAAKSVRGYDEISLGHLPAARRVREGEADCCLATKSAALVLGLEFIPLVTERYDLVVRRKHLKLPQVTALFETLGRAAFRRELEGSGGYDAANAGDILS